MVLPEPDAPIRATISPCCDFERHAAQHGHVDLTQMIGLGDVFEADQGHGRFPGFRPAECDARISGETQTGQADWRRRAAKAGFEGPPTSLCLSPFHRTGTAPAPEEGWKKRILGLSRPFMPDLSDDDLRPFFQIAGDDLNLGAIREARFDPDRPGKAILFDPDRRPLATGARFSGLVQVARFVARLTAVAAGAVAAPRAAAAVPFLRSGPLIF